MLPPTPRYCAVSTGLSHIVTLIFIRGFLMAVNCRSYRNLQPFQQCVFPLFFKVLFWQVLFNFEQRCFRCVSLQLPFTLAPETDTQSTGKWRWAFPALLIDNLNGGSGSAIRVWLQSRHRQVREQTWLDSKVDSTTDLSIRCAASVMRSFFVKAKTKSFWKLWVRSQDCLINTDCKSRMQQDMSRSFIAIYGLYRVSVGSAAICLKGILGYGSTVRNGCVFTI